MRPSNLLASAAAVAVAGFAVAQTARLHNGTVVTMVVPQETFSVEGPVWNIDVANKQVVGTGFRVTIPAILNNEPFLMGGTQIVNSEEVHIGEITTTTFDRLLDTNALMRDRIFNTGGFQGPIRLGPVRSLFSLTEARSLATADLVRDPICQKAMEDNFFFVTRNAFLNYEPGVLPANFLGLIGIRTETGAYPTSNTVLPPRRFWRYPAMSGATFIAQGSVYADAQGNRFNIPDFPIKGYLATMLLAENVLIGNLKATALGDFQTPDSYVIGNTLVMMNQDPRMPMDILGVANSPVSRGYFASASVPGDFIATVGHMVGEHVMMAEWVDATTSLFDPAVGTWVSIIDRSWGYRPGRGLSYVGDVVPYATTLLSYEYGHTNADGTWTAITPEASLQNILIPDPVLPTAKFVIRDQAGGDLVTGREIKFIVRDQNQVIQRTKVYNWATILGL
jgi:hypothetical protein